MCIIIYKTFACCRPAGEAHSTYVFDCQTEVLTLVLANQRPKMCVDVHTITLDSVDPARKCRVCAPTSRPNETQEPHTNIPKVGHDNSSHLSKTDQSLAAKVSLTTAEETSPIPTRSLTTSTTTNNSKSIFLAVANTPQELDSTLSCRIYAIECDGMNVNTHLGTLVG